MGASAVRQQALAWKSQGQALSSSKWPLPGPTPNPEELPPPRTHTPSLEGPTAWILLVGSELGYVESLDGPSQMITLPELPSLVHNPRVLFQYSGPLGGHKIRWDYHHTKPLRGL